MIQWLADRVPRGVLMIPVCLVGFNSWRWFELPLGAALNIAGALVVVAALARLRLASPEAVSTGCLVFLGGIAAVLAGDYQVARVFLGGLFLIAALSVTAESKGALEWALSAGLWSEFAVWLLGNTARGTFGADVAVSAIGQAYGAWAHPAQWAMIAAGYLAATWIVIGRRT